MPQITIALGLLAIPSILVGYYTKDMIVGLVVIFLVLLFLLITVIEYF
jgi:hypothetical protein